MMPELLCFAMSMRKNLGRVSSTALSSETRPLYREYLQRQRHDCGGRQYELTTHAFGRELTVNRCLE
jgi:hypothetical protein